MTAVCGPDNSALTVSGDGLGLLHPSAILSDAGLRQALATVARAPQLLVACDYDGTLAPVTDDLWSVRPLPEAAAALRSLAVLPATAAAVISGRALRELATMSRLPAEVHLVGSHGSEFDIRFVHTLDQRARADVPAYRCPAKDHARAAGGGARDQACKRVGARAPGKLRGRGAGADQGSVGARGLGRGVYHRGHLDGRAIGRPH